MDLKGRKVLVTGGASFIGSHLVDALLEKEVRSLLVIDDLSAGQLDNIRGHVKSGRIAFVKSDLREQNVMRSALRQQKPDMVFHLAADHGGRGYVDLHNAETANNLFLSGLVLHECVRAKVNKIVFASSGCVYPNNLQTDVTEELWLTEDIVGPPYLKPQDSDNMYGWEKLMTEMTLYHYVKGGKLPSAAACRYFTVYGPRGKVDHAILAMIARAFIKQDPFRIWGDGTALRNWTHVDDIVSGTIAAAECEKDFLAVNLGTMAKTSVQQAAELARNIANDIRDDFSYNPEFEYLPDMPVGPLNRICDNTTAQEVLGWTPKVGLCDGMSATAEWFFKTKNVEEVKKLFEDEKTLTER